MISMGFPVNVPVKSKQNWASGLDLSFLTALLVPNFGLRSFQTPGIVYGCPDFFWKYTQLQWKRSHHSLLQSRSPCLGCSPLEQRKCDLWVGLDHSPPRKLPVTKWQWPWLKVMVGSRSHDYIIQWMITSPGQKLPTEIDKSYFQIFQTPNIIGNHNHYLAGYIPFYIHSKIHFISQSYPKYTHSTSILLGWNPCPSSLILGSPATNAYAIDVDRQHDLRHTLQGPLLGALPEEQLRGNKHLLATDSQPLSNKQKKNRNISSL